MCRPRSSEIRSTLTDSTRLVPQGGARRQAHGEAAAHLNIVQHQLQQVVRGEGGDVVARILTAHVAPGIRGAEGTDAALVCRQALAQLCDQLRRQPVLP